jgi:hypothetical protein
MDGTKRSLNKTMMSFKILLSVLVQYRRDDSFVLME